MAVAGLHWHNSTQPAAMTHPPRWTQPELEHIVCAAAYALKSLDGRLKCTSESA